jgi:hypothetical protein
MEMTSMKMAKTAGFGALILLLAIAQPMSSQAMPATGVSGEGLILRVEHDSYSVYPGDPGTPAWAAGQAAQQRAANQPYRRGGTATPAPMAPGRSAQCASHPRRCR